MAWHKCHVCGARFNGRKRRYEHEIKRHPRNVETQIEMLMQDEPLDIHAYIEGMKRKIVLGQTSS